MRSLWNSPVNKPAAFKPTAVILLSIASILALFITGTYKHIEQDVAVNESSLHLEDSFNAPQLSNRFQHNFSTMVSGLRAFLTTREASMMPTYDSALSENKKIMALMSAQFTASSDQHIILDDIDQLQTYWLDEFAEPLIRAKEEAAHYTASYRSFQGMHKAKVATGLENDIESGIRNKFKEFTSIENESKHHVHGRLTNLFADTKMKSNLFIVSAIVLGLIVCGLLVWYIKSGLKRASNTHLVRPTNFDLEDISRIQKTDNKQLEPEEIIRKLKIAHAGKRVRNRKEVVDVEEILETIRDTVLSRNDITIRFTSPMPVLYTERVVLEQLLTNLIGNTIDFTGRRNAINFWWTCDKEFYQFYIQHHMVSNPNSEHVLHRLDAMKAINDVNEFEVGLALVKKIIQDRGLDLRVNIADSNSVFCFTWPKNEFNETYY